MTRYIQRTYKFDQREVREILVQWLKSKDMPQPRYVGDTPCTEWSRDEDGSVRVVWTEEDQIDVP